MQYPLKNIHTILDHHVALIEPPYLDLFQNLLKSIDQCMQEDLTETERFQNCFWISSKSYQELEHLVLQNGFANAEEEIKFFRNVKPKFTCFMEFFVTASEALWFVEDKAACAPIFWKEEMGKY